MATAQSPGDQNHDTPTNMTRQVPPLPHVVWRCIAAQLSDDLWALLRVASISSDLQEICRPHVSAHFHKIGSHVTADPTDLTDFYYHRVLQLVLEGYLDPSSIYQLLCWTEYKDKPSFDSLILAKAPRRFLNDTLLDKVSMTEQQTRKFDVLLRNAVAASRHIPPDMENEVCMSFQYGDPDAALAVLLPLCTKLKTFEIPHASPVCAAVVQSIAQEYRKRGIAGEEARQKAWDAALRDRSTPLRRMTPAIDALPLSELLILHVDGDHFYRHSFSLTEMVPYMGLPSLHRIILGSVRNHEFSGWPASDVQCSCPEIYFEQSSVTKRAVLGLAEGMEGPCEIRQWFERDADTPDQIDGGHVAWDRVIIERRADGSKATEARLDFEGGNPGCEYDWVSWLWHEKMKDWKRLDETFSLQDGDEDVDWLSGALA